MTYTYRSTPAQIASVRVYLRGVLEDVQAEPHKYPAGSLQRLQKLLSVLPEPALTVVPKERAS